MGNPAYDARREAERAEAEKERASHEAAKSAFEALTDLMTGKAAFHVTMPAPQATNMPMIIRIVRDRP